MTNTRHYHVLYGLDGCMPDSNEVHKTKKEAKEGLRFMRDMITESNSQVEEEFRDNIEGSIQNEYFTIGNSNSLYISECYEQDCLKEIEQD